MAYLIHLTRWIDLIKKYNTYLGHCRCNSSTNNTSSFHLHIVSTQVKFNLSVMYLIKASWVQPHAESFQSDTAALMPAH